MRKREQKRGQPSLHSGSTFSLYLASSFFLPFLSVCPLEPGPPPRMRQVTFLMGSAIEEEDVVSLTSIESDRRRGGEEERMIVKSVRRGGFTEGHRSFYRAYPPWPLAPAACWLRWWDTLESEPERLRLSPPSDTEPRRGWRADKSARINARLTSTGRRAAFSHWALCFQPAPTRVEPIAGRTTKHWSR